MRFAVVVTMVLSASVARADLAQDKQRMRLAAEQHEKDAKQRGDDASYVKCGQAYLDIYNLDPKASDIDEVLYNAAVCFEEGHSAGIALQMHQLIEKYAPSSKIRPHSIGRAAKLLDTMAMLPQAADKLEDYAKRYAGEKDAYQALSDAVFIRKGLGDDDKAIEDTKYFVRTFGAKKPKEAAAAIYSMTEIYRRKGPVELEKHLRDFLRMYPNVESDVRMRALLELGESVWKRSCSVPGVDGLCVKIDRPRVLPIVEKPVKATPASRRCGPASLPSITPVKRDPKLADEAFKLFKEVEKLGYSAQATVPRYFMARAMLLISDRKTEEYAAVRFPDGLDFSPDRKTAREASVRRFDQFVKLRTTLGGTANSGYEAIQGLKDPVMAIAASSRLGFISQSLAVELQTGAIPKDVRSGQYAKDTVEAFCDKMIEVSEPVMQRAIAAYDLCLQKSVELGIRDDWSRACARERANLGPTTYPLTAELLPQAPLPLPVFDEAPIRKSKTLQPAELRDPVEKFWTFYGAKPIPTANCLPLAQAFEKVAKQTRSADAWFMAGMTYGRCEREMIAKAKSAYDAALAIDPKHGKSISNLGELAIRTGAYDTAKAQWEASIKADPKLFGARLGLATLGLREYRALPPTSPNRKPLRAEIEFQAQNAAALGNYGSPLPYVQLGILAWLDNKPTLTKYFADIAAKIDRAPHTSLLLAAYHKGETASLVHLASADDGDWQIPETALALAIQQLATRQFDLAAKSLARVKGSNYDVLIARGILARGLGKTADAEARYADAAKLDPARPEAHWNLGVLYKDHVAARTADSTIAKAAFKKAADAFRRVNTTEAKQWADDCDRAAATR